VIDAGPCGNKARFLNHSCDPNCHTEKWVVNGRLCVGIFASRAIAKGTELTYDYGYEEQGGAPPTVPCLCGTDKCSGFLGKKPTRATERRR
jgi:SET domain-containing protein